MNKSTVLKIFIVIIIIVIIVIGILLSFLNINKENTQSENKEINEEQEDVTIEQQNNFVEVNEEGQFYNALHYINLYFSFIEDENNQAIKDTEYPKTMNANNEIQELEDAKFYAEKAYYKDFDYNHSLYIFEGKLEKDENYLSYVFGVILDYENSTYAVIRGNTVEEIKKITVEYNIEKNDNNKYEYYNAETNEIINSIFENFKLKVKQNLTEEGFNLLDNNYKTVRFENIDEYYNYINERKEIIENSIIVSYKNTTINEKEKYILLDEYNNYYIFFVTGPMEYTVMLDNYTIIDDETMNEYNSLDNYSKAHTNVDIFLKMINSKDYKHAYEKLEDTEKDRNLNSLYKFKEYIEKNFYEVNYLEVNYVGENDDGSYLVNTTIRNNISSAADSMNKNFIVKLNEGTDFVMSFEI